MAAFAFGTTVSRWTGRPKTFSTYMEARAAEFGDSTARKDFETMVLGLPHFEVPGTAASNDDTANTINLTTLGVTFPDATQRVIRACAHIADDNGMGLVETKGIVDGGATPIVVTDSADADPLVSGLAGTPTMVMSVSTADVILTLVGIVAVDTRWLVKIWVGDAVPLAYFAG